MVLTQAKINEEKIISKINGTGVLRHRLLEMGIIPGGKIRIVKIAPLGDPLQIRVRSYELSIRKEDASLIEVE